MKIEIRERVSGKMIMSLTIPFFQNPKEAVNNIAKNMGYLPCDVSWRAY